ncbi:MAG: Asp-tRNA(Asn)/Glu-tRNA(Gln) amidotransferase GatCAB subunit B, partial [Methanolinea sp.]|nr:Asp-tRNA(Asn)/Glu-tRNA(Gln) amidotransferase GatCAB subunit B [Methanolinea sp.]
LKKGTVTDKSGVEVLRALLDQLKETGSCESASQCVDRLGLKVLGTSAPGGEDPVTKAAKDAIAENPQAAADYACGKKEALNFLVGQVMKKTRGCAKPADVNRVLTGLLGKGV